MNREGRLVRIGDSVHQPLEHLSKLIRHCVTHRIRDIHRPRTRLDHGLENPAEKVLVGPPGILG